MERSRKIQPFHSDMLTPFCAKSYNSLNFPSVSLVSWALLLCLPPVLPRCYSGPAQSRSPGLAEGRSRRAPSVVAVCDDHQPGLASQLSGKGTPTGFLHHHSPIRLLSTVFMSFSHFSTSSGLSFPARTTPIIHVSFTKICSA